MRPCEFKIGNLEVAQRFRVRSKRGEGTYTVSKINDGTRVVLVADGRKCIKIDLERLLRDGTDSKGRLKFEPVLPLPAAEVPTKISD